MTLNHVEKSGGGGGKMMHESTQCRLESQGDLRKHSELQEAGLFVFLAGRHVKPSYI